MEKHNHPADDLDHSARVAQEWEQAFDATNDVIWIVDREQRILRCNQTSEALFGRPAAEMIGKYCWEIVHGTACPIPECPFPHAKVSCRRESVELQVDDCWFEVTVDPILDESGDFSRAVHIIRDISERRQLQRDLLESNERLRSITEASSEGIWQLDLRGRFIYVSKAAENIFGYTPEEALELGFAAFFVDSDLETAKGAFQKAVAGLEYQLLELTGRTKKGEPIPIEVSAMPFRREGKIIGVQGVARDITERKLVQDELRKSQSFNETLLNTTPDIIYIYDLVERKNIYSNQSIGTVLGYSVEEIQAMGDALIPSLMHPDDLKSYLSVILPLYQAARDGELIEHEYRMKHRDGAWRWLLSKESIHNRLPDGSPRQIIGIVGDISERHRITDALSQSEERYRLLFENMIDGFALHEIILDKLGTPVDYVFLEANSAFGNLTGLERKNLIGSRVTEVLPGIADDPADWIRLYGEVALTGKEARFEQYSHLLDRWYSVLAFSPREGQFATIFEDITQRRRADQRFRLISEVSTDLIYELTVGSDQLDWYGPLDEALGYKPGEIPRTISGWVSLIHPEDQEKLAGAVERHRTSTQLIYEEYRVQRRDGTWAYWIDRGTPVLDDEGNPTNGSVAAWISLSRRRPKMHSATVRRDSDPSLNR